MKELSIEEKARLYDEAIINGSRLWESDMITRESYEYIFPELRETEDDRIRKEIMDFLRKGIDGSSFEDVKEKYRTWLSWIQKEGEHANFRKKIQIGDKVTRNKDGMLVNLSQLNRAAKKDKKQGEQKPTEWHSEDEQNLNACLGFIPDEFLRRWLKNVVYVKYDNGKLEKIEQDIVWSKEDERLFQIVIDILDKENHLGNISHTDLIACVKKLKSLKPHPTWKPSDGQMDAFNYYLENDIDNEGVFGHQLVKLYQDLKKLKN